MTDINSEDIHYMQSFEYSKLLNALSKAIKINKTAKSYM